jgi:hypothetical protein
MTLFILCKLHPFQLVSFHNISQHSQQLIITIIIIIIIVTLETNYDNDMILDLLATPGTLHTHPLEPAFIIPPSSTLFLVSFSPHTFIAFSGFLSLQLIFPTFFGLQSFVFIQRLN